MNDRNRKDGNLVFNACPACGSSSIKPIRVFASFPAILFPIEGHKRNKVQTSRLEAECCDFCGHIFLNRIDRDFNEMVYRDYYYLYPYKNLETMQISYREPFERVVSMFLSPGSETLLEIGCDNIAQMQLFINLGYLCTAINPGATSADQVRFIDGFYGDTKVDGRFNYVVSRFNLEHILNLDIFFSALKSNLATGGIVIVQVPNIEQFLCSGLLNVFAHEHPHYFCRESLQTLIRRQGFEILYTSNRDEPSLICVFTRLVKKFQPQPLMDRTVRVLDELREAIESAPGDVVLYGAGLSVTGLLYTGKVDDKSLSKIRLVDDNSMLLGRYMPNSPLKVISAEEITLFPVVLVILMLSEKYQPKVVERLRELRIKAKLMAVTGKGLNYIEG